MCVQNFGSKMIMVFHCININKSTTTKYRLTKKKNFISFKIL